MRRGRWGVPLCDVWRDPHRRRVRRGSQGARRIQPGSHRHRDRPKRLRGRYIHPREPHHATRQPRGRVPCGTAQRDDRSPDVDARRDGECCQWSRVGHGAAEHGGALDVAGAVVYPCRYWRRVALFSAGHVHGGHGAPERCRLLAQRARHRVEHHLPVVRLRVQAFRLESGGVVRVGRASCRRRHGRRHGWRSLSASGHFLRLSHVRRATHRLHTHQREPRSSHV